jgi:hypothetical protein
MSDSPPNEERRHFTRIPIDNPAILICQGKQWRSRLLDLSLKGALIERPEHYQGQSEAHCTLEILLEPQDVVISMRGSLVHSEAGHLGFHCEHIDLESISHLKRLVELNLGDEALLERELSELAGAN